MKRILNTSGFTGRMNGRPAVCPRMRDIVSGAPGRSLPNGREP